MWITDSKGAEPRRLVIHGLAGNPSYPSWYPDGRHLLVVAYQQKDGGVLHRVDTLSGKTTALTDPAAIRAGMPALSPDGKIIVFAGQRNDGGGYDQKRNQIWLLKEGEAPLPFTSHQGRAATWSPSGKWIAYESNHGSPDERQAIFIISADGKDERRVTDYTVNANHPVWSPDGRTLAMSISDPGRTGRTRIATLPVELP